MAGQYHLPLDEDDPVTRRRMAECFRSEGFMVGEAADGPDMQRMLRDRRIDLVLLDVNLPGEAVYRSPASSGAKTILPSSWSRAAPTRALPPARPNPGFAFSRAGASIWTGGPSAILRKNIALCRMNIADAEDGTKAKVGKLAGHQKRVPATVVPFPFYDRKRERLRT